MRLLTTIAVFALCMSAVADEFKVTPRSSSFSIAERTKPVEAAPADAERKFTLHMWTANWCGYCPAAIAEARAAADDLGITLSLVDFDKWRDVSDDAGIEAPPTLCIVSNNQIHERLKGGAKRQDIVTKVREWQRRWGVHQAQVGTVATYQPNVSSTPQKVITYSANRFANYGGTQYDLETWSPMCRMRNCGMCNYLNQQKANYMASKQYQYQYQAAVAPSPQSASPQDVVDEAIAIMKLTANDTVAELGSGDGLPAIKMAQKTGCYVIGVEIDPVKVAKSRENVTKAGLDGRIMIIEGDVRDFSPEQYGVTATYAYLYPELLAEIPKILSAGRITVCPGHKPEGLDTKPVGQCWVRESSLQGAVVVR